MEIAVIRIEGKLYFLGYVVEGEDKNNTIIITIPNFFELFFLNQ